MRSEPEAELRKLAERLPESAQTPWQNATILKGLTLLGISIVRLDKTSSRLAIVNIALTVVILVVGILQVVLMLKGN